MASSIRALPFRAKKEEPETIVGLSALPTVPVPTRLVRTVPVLTISPVVSELELKIITVSEVQSVGLKFSFRLTNANPFIAVRIREIILTDIPTMAIACVEIPGKKNVSLFDNERVAQLLSFVILHSNNVHLFSPARGCDLSCLPLPCFVQYQVKVAGQPGKIREITGADLRVVGESYGVVPVKYNVPTIDGSIVEVDQSILNLMPDHKLDLTCWAMAGTQKKDAKWGCVSAVGYELEADGSIKFNGELRGNLAIDQILAEVSKRIDAVHRAKSRQPNLRLEMVITAS